MTLLRFPMMTFPFSSLFFLCLTFLPLLVQEVDSEPDPKFLRYKKQWDSMDQACRLFCQYAWNYWKGQGEFVDGSGEEYGARIFCYFRIWSGPETDATRAFYSQCKTTCEENCKLACHHHPDYGEKYKYINCPHPGYPDRLPTTTSTTTTTEEAPTTDAIFILEDPAAEDEHMSLSSYLGEPGSLQFGLTIAGIVVAVLVVICLIVACCLSATGRGGPREEQSESVSPAPGSTSTFQFPEPKYRPSPKAPPAVHRPQPRSPEEDEVSLHVTFDPIPKTRSMQQMKMESGEQQQQFAYQLVPMPLGDGGGGQTQQQFMPMGHGHQPMVIYLPHDFASSEGTPVLIPLPAGPTDAGGGKGKKGAGSGSGSEAHSTTTEADNDDD